MAFPKTPAWEFARFVALAKSGHPFMGAMVVEDVPGKRVPAMDEALKEQQRVDLDRSFEYCRKVLNVGVNWRGEDKARLRSRGEAEGSYGVTAIWFWLVETPPITTVNVSVPPGGNESGSRRLICMMPATKPGASPAKTTSKERESPAQTVASAL